MNPDKRDDFIRVGDHSPERRSGGSVPEPRWHDRPTYSHTLEQDQQQRRVGKRRALAMGYRSGTMRDYEYTVVWKSGDHVPSDVAERQLDLYSFALTGGPRITDDSEVVMLSPGSYSLDNGKSWCSHTELLRRASNGDDLAAIDGAAFHPLGDAERDRQFAKLTALPVNQATQLAAAPVDSPVCKCHDRMGNDWYFLPSGMCLFDINECTDPTRRQTKP